MERAIGCVKQYRVLSSVIPLSIAPFVNIWYICCALSLFHPHLVVDVDKLSDADLARIKCVVAAELNLLIFLHCIYSMCNKTALSGRYRSVV